nr:zinc finger protein 629-like [Biomphalaria glabrata]
MDSDVLRLEEYMDVLYRCKFCPFTCSQSSEMSSHVRANHLSILISTHNNSPTSRNCDLKEECVSFAPLAIPVSQGGPLNLSNNSTPDLTELINLVKPPDGNNRNHAQADPGSHFSPGDASQYHTSLGTCLPVSMVNGDCLSDNDNLKSSVLQLHPGQTHLSSMSQPFSSNSVVSADLDVSQPYTVMAIHLPNLPLNGSNSVSQYVMGTNDVETVNISDHSETKEFLLCGLCKLAFTTMEECQTHMQLEHKELMQGSGISIGVQAGGAKRGRKRKSEQQHKIKTESYIDTEDIEWLPSVADNSRTTHPDGSLRRRIKPPRALKEDYVLGKCARKRLRESCMNLGYKIVCPMMSCKAKFKTDLGLHIHLSCHNMDNAAFTCMKCQAPHEFWKHLRIHLWKEHKVDCDLFQCDQCDYKTDTHHKMSIHKEIHTNVKPYTCDICNKGFRQASQMKNHQVIHTNREEKCSSRGWFSSKSCDICDRVFANSKCLKKHKEAVHTNHKPFECMYCNHTTARKAMMELHIRTHTGEKPFKCDICPYSTGDHNSMRRHKMRHTGQKQYRCTQCPYTCIQSISLKQHMRHKHPGTSAGIFQCSRCPFRTINQCIYSNHMQDHKKGLIPDKIIPPRIELPKVKKYPSRSQSGKRQSGGATLVEPLLMKHPQFHAVLPGNEPTPLTSLTGELTSSSGETQSEVFTMQVTMLAEGDTQISADDMNRLSESAGLMASGITPFQLIYATLSTISEQGEAARVGEGRSALLTAELVGGIHTAILSSMQDGVTVHSITYHLPRAPATEEQINVGVNGLLQKIKVEKKDGSEEEDSQREFEGGSALSQNLVVADDPHKCDDLFYLSGAEKNSEPVTGDRVEHNVQQAVSGDRTEHNIQQKMNMKKRLETRTESSALRAMLECRDKMTILTNDTSDVSFLSDFLEPHPIDPSSQVFTTNVEG